MSDADQNAGSTTWTARDEAGHPFALQVITWIALHLGRGITRLILHPITLYFLVVRRAERRASHAFLTRVLKRKAGVFDLYRHFLTFSTVTLDRLYFVNDRFDLFDIQLYGSQEVHKHLAASRSFFLLGAHFGSFEAIRASRRFFEGVNIGMVMYEDNARKLHATLAAINPAVVENIIPLGRLDSMLRVRDRLDAGDQIGMLGDRAIGAGKTQRVNFLGEPATFSLGPLRMAAMLQRPVMFMAGVYRGGKRYDIHFEPLADFSDVAPTERDAKIAEALARYVQLLERHCTQAPYNWFNFYDFWHEAR